ncbi:MAG: protein kinase, partial [Chloroflexota bacterium]
MQKIINGRYVLQDKIGVGGMGAVYKATDRLTGQTVALKQVNMNHELMRFDSTPYDEILSRLRMILAKEFQVLAGLRHPHIISVLDYGFDEKQQPFYTMTYLSKSQTILEAGKNLSYNEKVSLIEQLLQGLAYLHQRGILHRDIKPDNVLVVNGTVKLLDFGLSQKHGDKGDIGGSPQYMAIELIEGDKASQESDLYAVGVLLYQLMTAKHPFGQFNSDFYGRLYSIEPDWSTISESLYPILSSMLDKSAAKRPQSAIEVLNNFAEFFGVTTPRETDEIRESYLQAATFIGRQSELTELKTGLIQAQNNQGVVYLLGGESGVGKSRLLDEFRTHALVAGWQVLTGQEIAEEGVPYQLWQNIVLRLALNTELNDLDAGILQEISPAVSKSLGRFISSLPNLAGPEGEQRLMLTFISLLKRQTNPILLILEDLHWSLESLSPLKQIIKVLDQLSGIMVVGSFRDDERPHLPSEIPEAKLLKINRLDKQEISQLSEAILGKVSSRSEIVSFLSQETEGNTFFIVEVMRALAEDAGHLLEIGETTLPKEVLTSGMDALLQRRINKVFASNLPLLQLAAVAGRQLDLNLLQSLLPDIDIDEWLQNVSDAAIITIRADQWLFSHDKLRQATLALLPHDHLQRAHQKVAITIEKIYSNDVNTFPNLLAHWRAAGNSEKELNYLLPVAQRLVSVSGDYTQAQVLAKRGLSRLSTTDLRRIELLNLLADIYTQRAEFANGEQAANEAYALAKTNQDMAGQAKSLNILGVISREQSQYSRAKAYFQKALVKGKAANDIMSKALSLVQLGVVAEFQKDYEIAKSFFKQSLSLSQAINDLAGITQCYFYLGMLEAQHHNNFEVSLDYSRKSLEIHQQLGNQRSISKIFTSMGIDYASMGQYAIACDYFQKSLAIKETLGDPGGIAHTYLVLGESHFFEGVDYRQALSCHEQALEMKIELNALSMIGIVYGYIALCHCALGDYPSAVQAALSHFELQETIEFDKSNGLVHVAVAKILAAYENRPAITADDQDKLDRIEELTHLALSSQTYIEKAIQVSTIAQIRLVVLIECGQLSMMLENEEAAVRYLTEAQMMAENSGNQVKLREVEML